jgi:hypothetical protein
VQVVPAPNPERGNRLSFDIKLDGTAQFMRFRIYSPAMVMVYAAEVEGNFRPGWNQVQIPASHVMVPGLYYAVVQGGRGSGSVTGAQVGRFVYWP